MCSTLTCPVLYPPLLVLAPLCRRSEDDRLRGLVEAERRKLLAEAAELVDYLPRGVLRDQGDVDYIAKVGCGRGGGLRVLRWGVGGVGKEGGLVDYLPRGVLRDQGDVDYIAKVGCGRGGGLRVLRWGVGGVGKEGGLVDYLPRGVLRDQGDVDYIAKVGCGRGGGLRVLRWGVGGVGKEGGWWTTCPGACCGTRGTWTSSQG